MTLRRRRKPKAWAHPPETRNEPAGVMSARFPSEAFDWRAKPCTIAGFFWGPLACQRWSLAITRVNLMNAAHLSPSPAGWLLQFQRGRGPLWELACQRWALAITRVSWINAAHLSPSPAGWLLQFQRGRGPLWELACQRWSLTITRVNLMNAAHWSPSPASWLLQ